MTYEEAILETRKLFGDDSFAECDDQENDNGIKRYYVGRCPKLPGIYQGYMGFSWEEALDYAKGHKVPDESTAKS